MPQTIQPKKKQRTNQMLFLGQKPPMSANKAKNDQSHKKALDIFEEQQLAKELDDWYGS